MPWLTLWLGFNLAIYHSDAPLEDKQQRLHRNFLGNSIVGWQTSLRLPHPLTPKSQQRYSLATRTKSNPTRTFPKNLMDWLTDKEHVHTQVRWRICLLYENLCGVEKVISFFLLKTFFPPCLQASGWNRKLILYQLKPALEAHKVFKSCKSRGSPCKLFLEFCENVKVVIVHSFNT